MSRSWSCKRSKSASARMYDSRTCQDLSQTSTDIWFIALTVMAPSAPSSNHLNDKKLKKDEEKDSCVRLFPHHSHTH